MAVDTQNKRMAVAHLKPRFPGKAVPPGAAATTLGRAARAWNYSPDAPVPVVGGEGDSLITLGLESSSSVTSTNPTLGGFLGH